MESKENVPVPDHSEQENEDGEIGETSTKTKEKKFGSDKPEFKRPMACTITASSFQTDGQTVTTTIKEGKQVILPEDKHYKKHWLQCSFEYVDKDGKHKSFDQSYGSIREYPGRLWMGSSNNLAQLKSLLEEFISVPLESPWDMAKELVNKKCTVKSKPWEFGNNKGFSNLVQDFVEEKK